MKYTFWNKYSIVILFFLLFICLIGCTSTYRVNDFTSKEQFIEKINKSTKDSPIKVVLTNDSIYDFENGVEIKNDTLYSLGKNIPTQNKQIAISDTKEINYADGFYPSALILLKDGEEFQANDVKVHNDSIYFSYDKIFTTEVISSMNQVENINYKNHWLGVPGMLILGTGSGAGIGAIIGSIIPEVNGSIIQGSAKQSINEGVVIGSFIGFITGTIIGYIIGYNYKYEFDVYLKMNR